MYQASIITVSDRAAHGVYEDQSGPTVRSLLEASGYLITHQIIIPDEKNKITTALLSECEQGIHLIITTGGTGFSPRDVTPEATIAVIEREAPGIAEYMRQRSMEITPRGMLSRGIAGIRGSSLIVNLPGSPKAARENLGFILPHLTHGLDMLNGKQETNA
ncbi:molybdenum cofactor biosynthesis protein B [Ruminococcus sp.]|uniref:MogA/MoaB family molybdenum cofactor biosynthesis protein n=1 Tax=Ruminococcus sp. TaxID=41978 RepID=UPI003890082C